MKFINYLESIAGISIYPLISLALFVVFFVGVSISVFRSPKAAMKQLGNLPLD
jgi:hypothetical protein